MLILSLLDNQSLQTVALTCKAADVYVRPFLLRHVYFSGPPFDLDVRHFCKLVLERKFAHHIKSFDLDLALWPTDPDVNTLFLQVLDQATTLADIRVKHVESYWSPDPVIWNIVSTHPSFSSLHIDRLSEVAAIPDTTHVRGLRRLVIHQDRGDVLPAEVRKLLSEVSDTLYSLDLRFVPHDRYGRYNADTYFLTSLLAKGIRFPRLTSLETDQILTVENLVQDGSFPSLTHLRAHSVYLYPGQIRDELPRLGISQDLQHVECLPAIFLDILRRHPIPKRLTDVVLARWTFEQDIASMCEAFSSCDLHTLSLSLVIGDSVYFLESLSSSSTSGACHVLQSLSRTAPHLTTLQLGLHLQIDSPIGWKMLSRVVSPCLSRLLTESLHWRKSFR